MFVNTFFRRVLFNFAFLFVFLSINFLLFYKVYTSNVIIITFTPHHFNICEKFPEIWEKLKLIYIPISFLASLILINLIYSMFFTRKKSKKSKSQNHENELSLFISNDEFGNSIILPEPSLYQNILITGTIGTGKTSSAMYPFTRQLIKYNYDDDESKLGMLILDVKGNYYSQVKKYASHYRRENDFVVVELRWKCKI